MTKKYSTKRALVASVLLLALCFTSLVGTTFAWFTDSVTSSNNVIKSGNLDIKLEYLDNNGNWADVNGKSDILTNQLWEPGVTEVAYFRIENAGSLALKYQFGINILSEISGKNVAGESFLLSDYIKFGVIEGVNGKDNAYADRDAAVTAVGEAKKISAGYLKADSMNAGDVLYLALVVYMPTSVGNEANHNGINKPQIDLGINVVATQLASEDDSFGSDYDEDAWHPEMQVYTAEDLQAAINNAVSGTEIILMNTVDTTKPLVVPASESATYSLRSNSAIVLNLNGNSIVGNFDKSLGHVIKNEGNLVITNGTVSSAAVNGSSAIYNAAGASLVLEDVVINGAPQSGDKWPSYAINSYGTLHITEGVTVTSNHGAIALYGKTVIDDVDVTMNGFGGSSHVFYIGGEGTEVTINGGVYTHKGNVDGSLAYIMSGASVIVNDGYFTASNGGYGLAAYGGSLTVNGGTFDNAFQAWGGPIIVNGGNYKTNPSNYVSSGYSAVANSDGTYVVIPGENASLVSNGFYFDGVDTYYITTAEGLFAFAASVNKYSNYEYPYQNETVILMNDIDLENAEWTPIGDYRFSANRFCGTFDGQGHTISNYQITKKTDKNDSNKSSYGFFGNVEGTVKNLTVSNANISSYAYTGALIGRLNSGLVENCHVVNSTVAPSYWQGGIMIGQVNGGSVNDCTVTGSSISGKSALGGMFGPVTAENGDILFENCTVIDSDIAQNGTFGANFDNYFGCLFGYIECGDNRVDINNCSAINTTVKGEASTKLSGDNDGDNIYVDGVNLIVTAEALQAALTAGGNIVLGADIAMESIYIQNPNFVLDGNGYTITQTGTNTYALIDTQGGSVTLKNVTFDGINGGAVVRTVDAKFNADNVVVKNSNHTQQQGLFRLMGESTIENCTFVNNNCSMAISLNYDGANNDPQIVKNCVFENNTCNSTAVLYYVKGAGCTVDGNKFVNNTVSADGNAATVYMGFTENNVITNNIFQGNDVTGTSKRVAGALMVGYAAKISGNAFIDNTVSGSIEGLGNDVCASVYYTDIDLSGNYWGGSAPVENDNYYVEYPDRHVVVINDYLTTYGE